VGEELRHLGHVVLESDGEPLRMSQVGERGVEDELRRLGDRQAGRVRVGLDVVELDRVEAVGLAAIDPGVDLAEDEAALSLVVVDVEPALLTEARDRLPEETAAARGVEVEVVLEAAPEG